MKRPHKNPTGTLRLGVDNNRVTFSNPLGTRQLSYTRLGRIDRETGERADPGFWLVTATKPLPWQTRARNRRNNKLARASRKRNYGNR